MFTCSMYIYNEFTIWTTLETEYTCACMQGVQVTHLTVERETETEKERDSLVTDSAFGFPHFKTGVPFQLVHVDVGVVLL